MSDLSRQPTQIEYRRKRYDQVDAVPNLLVFFPQARPFSTANTYEDRFYRKPHVLDFQQSSAQTIGIPAVGNSTQIVRDPIRVPIFPRKTLQPDLTPNLTGVLYQIAAPKPPTINPQFPDIFRRNIGADILGMEGQSFLPGPGQLPFFPWEFPTPIRARQLPQDFTFSTTSIPPPAPFSQSDWPLYLARRTQLFGTEWNGITTRGIPAGIVAPFQQDDWPVPMRPKWAQADSSASPQIVLTTPVLRPFAQTEFPNPLPARRVREDWIWPATSTIGIPPIQPPSGPFAAVFLEGYGVDLQSILLRWTLSLGAAGYRVYINGVPQAQILTRRFTTISGLAINTTYVFNVVCVNTFGVDASILSNPVYFEHGSNEIGTYHTKPWN